MIELEFLHPLALSLCSAAGKSTFVRLLEQESGDWEVVPEPIARWCNVQTNGSDFEVLASLIPAFCCTHTQTLYKMLWCGFTSAWHLLAASWRQSSVSINCILANTINQEFHHALWSFRGTRSSNPLASDSTCTAHVKITGRVFICI